MRFKKANGVFSQYILEVKDIIAQKLPPTLGDLKQAIMREYNQVNQMIFKVGVIEQKVNIFDNNILILAKHRRISVLKIIDESDGALSNTVDRILIEKSKALLQKNFGERFGFEIQLIIKDYIASKEMSVTLILLDKNVEEYLTG